MGQIRKQTIQSSFLSYVGFLLGAINTYFFTKKGLFTPEQYGLTQTITSMAQVFAALGTFGVTAFMGRFYPWYQQNLPKKENDMLGVVLIFTAIGATLVLSGSLILEPIVVRKFSARSTMLVQYYYWTLVFGVSLLCFMVLETYFATLRRTVLPNFLKETIYRSCVSILIILYAFQVISFNTFVILFTSIYFLIVIVMVIFLAVKGELLISFRISKISRRIRKPALIYGAFVYSGVAINAIAKQIDTLALASVRSLGDAGIYTLNQFAAAVIQVPFRALQAIAAPMIALHWKNKNISEINRIYKRASINMLLISSLIFQLIWFNYEDGLTLLNLNQQFATGKIVFLILGIYNIIELTVGISSQVINTSPAWRFEFYSGLLLLFASIPLNIFMARWNGMTGVALATLITFSLYNLIRVLFVKKRFGLWPFTIKTVYALALILIVYGIVWVLTAHWHGVLAIFVRTILITALYLGGTLVFRITPDLPQVLDLLLKKTGLKKTN